MTYFYKKYCELCAAHGKSASGVAVAIGLSNAAASGWKKGKKPSDITLEKLAKYFNVPVSELTGEPENEKAPTPVAEGEQEDPVTAQIMDIVGQMSPEERRLYLENLKTLRLLQEQGRKPDIQE